MIETILGQKIQVVWTSQSGGVAGNFLVKGLYPPLQLICLQAISETDELTGNPSWTRMQDIDQMEVLNKNYNPLAKAKQSSQAPTPEGTATRATLTFDLPDADQEFYIATHANNAFSALFELGRRLKKEEKHPKKNASSEQTIKELHQFFQKTLFEMDIILNY